MTNDDKILQRFSSDLRLAGKAARTVESYIYAARRLRRVCGKPFAEITEDDLREYLTDLVDQGFARGTFSINLCGIRFLFRQTLGRDWNLFDLVRPKYDKKLPVVLSRSEVWRILDSVTIPVRVAITNRRILAFDGVRVRIQCKGSLEQVTLDADELLRRYLQHVLPRGFVKVRYTGLWASARRDRLDLARRILERQLEAEGKVVQRPIPDENQSMAPSRRRCPYCGAVYESPPTRIPRQRGPP